jgi:geranylgeranyl diphosphate synthase type I
MDWLTSLYPDVRRTLLAALPSYWPNLTPAYGPLLGDPIFSEVALPLAACRAVGGQPADAVPVAAALLMAEMSLRIFDDLADQDRNDALWLAAGQPKALNYAAAAVVLAFDILSKAPLPDVVFRRVNQLFLDAFMLISAGQEHDFDAFTTTVDEYWTIMELKTASAYAAACMGGAMVGTSDPALIEACRAFGHHLGLAMQIFNDMESIWRPEGLTDIQKGKPTLPLLYGLQFDHPERDELARLIKEKQLTEQPDRVKAILDGIDAQSFMVWAALREREQALAALAPCPDEAGKEALTAYITALFGDIEYFVVPHDTTPQT